MKRTSHGLLLKLFGLLKQIVLHLTKSALLITFQQRQVLVYIFIRYNRIEYYNLICLNS